MGTTSSLLYSEAEMESSARCSNMHQRLQMVKLEENATTESRGARKEVRAAEQLFATPAEKADHITETNGLKQISEDITRNREKISVVFPLLPKLKCTHPRSTENRWSGL